MRRFVIGGTLLVCSMWVEVLRPQAPVPAVQHVAPQAAPATEPAQPPPPDIALQASKAYTKAMAAFADYQQAVRLQQDNKKTLDEAQAALRDITEKAKVAQHIPAHCTLSPDIQWIQQTGPNSAPTPCMMPIGPSGLNGPPAPVSAKPVKP